MADEFSPSTAETRPEHGPGTLLRAAREQKGLSLQDVADGLNLKPRVVEALEHERYEQLPPRTFIKGYYKSYAKLVGVKEYDVLAALDRQMPEQTPTPLTPAAHERDVGHSAGGWFKWLLLLALIGVALLLAFGQLDRSEPAAVSPQPAAEPPIGEAPSEATPQAEEPTSTLPVPAPVADPDDQIATVPAPDSSAEPAAPQEAPEQSSPATQAPAVQVPAAQAPAAETSPSAPADAAAQGQLVVELSGESWLEVRDATGQRRFVGIGRGPRTLEFAGPPPFALVIGDVTQVTLRYNGEPVSLAPFARGKVARLSVPTSR